MDQEAVDTRSLATISKDLIHQSIFLHRDKGVKAYAACCMTDLLRLYAPDAPYTALELKVSGLPFDLVAHPIYIVASGYVSIFLSPVIHRFERNRRAVVRRVCLSSRVNGYHQDCLPHTGPAAWR